MSFEWFEWLNGYDIHLIMAHLEQTFWAVGEVAIITEVSINRVLGSWNKKKKAWLLLELLPFNAKAETF